jgi:hypothetical protein
MFELVETAAQGLLFALQYVAGVLMGIPFIRDGLYGLAVIGWWIVEFLRGRIPFSETIFSGLVQLGLNLVNFAIGIAKGLLFTVAIILHFLGSDWLRDSVNYYHQDLMYFVGFWFGVLLFPLLILGLVIRLIQAIPRSWDGPENEVYRRLDEERIPVPRATAHH